MSLVRRIVSLENKFATLATIVRSLPRAGTPRPKFPLGSGGSVVVPGFVVAWAVLEESGGVAYRWKYRPQVRQVEPVTFKAGAAATTDPWADWPAVFALNWDELTNIPQNTGVQGDSVDQRASDGYPATWRMRPVGGGSGGVPDNECPILLWQYPLADGTPQWWFSKPNAHGGSCT